MKLQTIRKQKGYTQQQVADYIATDVSNYSRKENGDVKIFSDEWVKISKFIGIPMEDIYEEDNIEILPSKFKNTNNKLDREPIYLSIISNLQDYIALLKEENERLKK